MKPNSFIHESLKPLVHLSGWPYMTAKCCGSRVNHCRNLTALAAPEKYGDGTVTHTQEWACRCGKTVLVVEGTLERYQVVGCFGVKMEGAA